MSASACVGASSIHGNKLPYHSCLCFRIHESCPHVTKVTSADKEALRVIKKVDNMS